MMIDEMLSIIAKDLGINRYFNEPEIQYNNRIIYSALACWIKTATLDRPISNTLSETTGVSRRHIIDKCNPVLSELIARIPELKPYFDVDNDNESAVTILRERLIRSGDINNGGFNTNLILSTSNIIRLSQNLECVIGSIIESNSFYSGVAMLRLADVNFNYTNDEMISSVEWIKKYTRYAWWNSIDAIDEEVQFYNAYVESPANHTCWQIKQPDSVEGIILARKVVNKNTYEYMLIKKDNNLFCHRIDPFLQEINDHRRFMIALRKMAQNPVPAQVILYDDHVNFKLRVYMPEKESRLLETYAWPQKSITNRLMWDMPLQIWEYIKPSFEKLGLNITEVSNG